MIGLMPIRYIPFINGHFYHIYNRGVEKRRIFLDKREHRRFIDTLTYYRYQRPQFKYSRFLKLSVKEREMYLTNLAKTSSPLVTFVSYVLMPNHFHLLVQQLTDDGISRLMKLLLDSYTRYFNTKNERVGPLLQGQFKAVRVESDEQLLHLSRYIHLNPYTSYLVKTIDNLHLYPWSSLQQYFGGQGICDTSYITGVFSTKKSLMSFIVNNADYQRKLEEIKHLMFD